MKSLQVAVAVVFIATLPPHLFAPSTAKPKISHAVICTACVHTVIPTPRPTPRGPQPHPSNNHVKG